MGTKDKEAPQVVKMEEKEGEEINSSPASTEQRGATTSTTL